MEKNDGKLSAMLAELIKTEIKFLEENNAIKNENGFFAYESQNGNHKIDLAHFLQSYKVWLLRRMEE